MLSTILQVVLTPPLVTVNVGAKVVFGKVIVVSDGTLTVSVGSTIWWILTLAGPPGPLHESVKSWYATDPIGVSTFEPETVVAHDPGIMTPFSFFCIEHDVGLPVELHVIVYGAPSTD